MRPRAHRLLDVQRRRRRMASLLVLLVLVLLVMLGVKACAAERRVSEPTVTNLPQAQAVQALRANGLQAQIRTEYSDTIATGRVTRTDPDAGTRLAHGATVTTWVSLGVERDTVPAVVGQTRDAATRALTDAHLRLGRVDTAWSQTVPTGTVMQASPSAGTVLRHGTRVDLTVSGGRRPVALGDLTGTPADRDAATLKAQGLTVVTRQQNSDTVPLGQVMSQTPGPGTVHVGDTVTLVVSEGPEQVAVPDVQLKSEADARAALTAAGFTVRVSYATPSWLRADMVATESPIGTAPRGSTITIWVG